MATLTHSEIDAIAAAAASPDPKAAGRAILAVLHGLPIETVRYDVRTRIWSCAMTLAYGPSGLHPSRCDEDGHPTAATLADFPVISESWDRARERLEIALDVARREVAS